MYLDKQMEKYAQKSKSSKYCKNVTMYIEILIEYLKS